MASGRPEARAGGISVPSLLPGGAGRSQRFLDKARGLAADEVFPDLEDAVAPAAKEAARRHVIAALNAGCGPAQVAAVRAGARWTGA